MASSSSPSLLVAALLIVLACCVAMAVDTQLPAWASSWSWMSSRQAGVDGRKLMAASKKIVAPRTFTNYHCLVTHQVTTHRLPPKQ